MWNVLGVPVRHHFKHSNVVKLEDGRYVPLDMLTDDHTQWRRASR